MKTKIKVDGYNFNSLPTKHWKFYVGDKIVNKKIMKEALRLNMKSIFAVWKEKLSEAKE